MDRIFEFEIDRATIESDVKTKMDLNFLHDLIKFYWEKILIFLISVWKDTNFPNIEKVNSEKNIS